MEIKVSYTAIDTAVKNIEQQIAAVRKAKTKIGNLPFGSKKQSSGPCVKELSEITCTELINAADAIIALMTNTNDFLCEAKRVWIDTDEAIAK